MSARTSAGHLFRALPDLFRVGIADMVAYRAEMTIWILSATMPLIMLALWNAVAAGGPIGGFSQGDLARYFAATLLVRQLTATWLIWELNVQIRTGALSPRLLKPMHPLIQNATETLCAIPLRVTILLPVLLALTLWRPDIATLPSPGALVLFIPAIALAWCLAFLFQAIFATLSFWLDKTDGLFSVWLAVWTLLSGYVAPLALFPDWSIPILRALPFRGMLAVPVELLSGTLAPHDALPDIAVQLAWVCATFLLLRVLWRRGLVRYGAFGA